MRLLVCLATRRGDVVSIDELIDTVWEGVAVSPDSVYQAVTSLRRQLGDDPRQPTYIATMPRLGYRMVAAVSAWEDRPATDEKPAEGSIPVRIDGGVAGPGRGPAPRSLLSQGLAWATGVVLCVCLAVAWMVRGRAASDMHASTPAVTAEPQRSVAVLPFLDLTEGMKEEEFADGMTEELIDRLSKVQGLKVPAPTAVFFYKGKQLPIADMAHSLGVAYVLDGSVRKSGGRVRVAARLVRAGNGYVMWTETYDRPFGDILMVQDDIAGEVTKALKVSIPGAAQ
jgi:transcriptional activator of cad operon